MPTSGECDDGDTRSLRDEQDDHTMSIFGKGYLGRDSRQKTHFAVAADQRGAENVGRFDDTRRADSVQLWKE